jgi:hypothetical protein
MKNTYYGLKIYKSNIIRAFSLNGGRGLCGICLVVIKSIKFLKSFHMPPIIRLTKSTIHSRTSPTVAVSSPHVSFIGPCLFKDAFYKSRDVALSGRFMSE